MPHPRDTTPLFLAALLSLLALPIIAADVPGTLPDPDDAAADTSKPLQIYILMGQSNMVGFGQVGPADTKGTLEYVTSTGGKDPDFKGNVATIDARPFWRETGESPKGAGHHYNHNAETYVLVGEALGRAMAGLKGQGE